MKSELNKHGVKLIDVYGIISNQEVNTLEHLGVSYPWSVYSPSKKSELLEAERGKEEKRDILSRMIGAEVRYTRLGYRVRLAPFGYVNQKIETIHGKRFILAPHPTESIFIKRMYELRIKGIYSDQEIIDQINVMGFKTRRFYLRSPNNINKIIGIRGENKLDIKRFDRLIRSPIYAGVTCEKWTKHEPLKCNFEGLISIDNFNKANMGRIMIIEENEEVKILKGELLKKRLVATSISQRYPYKQLVFCSKCCGQFCGSASKGRQGKYYPAYHCSKNGHYLRIPLDKFHGTIVNYLKNVRIKAEHIDAIQAVFIQDHENKILNAQGQTVPIRDRLLQIDAEITLSIEKIKILHSDIALQALEKEIEMLKEEKQELLNKQTEAEKQISNGKDLNLKVSQKTSNRIPQFIIDDHTATIKTQLFHLLFIQLPTYDELVNKTAKLKPEFEMA